jgi:hypothetical protein
MSCGVMCTLAAKNDLVIRIARRSNFPFTDESNERAFGEGVGQSDQFPYQT